MISNVSLRIGALLVALCIGGCQTAVEPKPTELPRELRFSSVVSTSSASFTPASGTRLQWRGDIAVHASPETPADPVILAYIRNQLEEQMAGKGYQWVNTNGPADYLVQAVLIIGNELSERSLRDVLGFDPGLAAQGNTYQTGTLLVMLIKPAGNDTQWRSAVQVLAAPELAEEQRQLRIRHGVANLLRPLPDISALYP